MNEWINERTDVCINNWTLWKANQSNLLQLICDILQTYRIPARGSPLSVSPSQMYYYGSKLVLISSLVAHQTSGQITFGLRLEPRHNKSIINVFFPFFPFFFRGRIGGQRGRFMLLVCTYPTKTTQIRKLLTNLDKTVEIWKELSKADEIVTNLIMQLNSSDRKNLPLIENYKKIVLWFSLPLRQEHNGRWKTRFPMTITEKIKMKQSYS